MSLLRYKTLLTLTRNSTHNIEYQSEIGLRFYSEKIILSSAPPHYFRSHKKKLDFTEGLNQEKVRKPKKNFEFTKNQPKKAYYNKQYVNKVQNSAKYEDGLYDDGEQDFPEFDEELNQKRVRKSRKNIEYDQTKTQPRKSFFNRIQDCPLHENEFSHEEEIHLSKSDSRILDKRVSTSGERKGFQSKKLIEEEIIKDPDSRIWKVSTFKEYKGFQSNKLVGEEMIEDSELNNTNEENSLVLPSTENENSDLELNTKKTTTLRYKTMETPAGTVEYNLSADEFNLNKYVKEFNDSVPGPLDECKEDLSTLGPNLRPTFNFGAYADESELIQEYVKLGVKLYKIEENLDHMRALLSVDMEKELPIYIQFLHDCGIPAESLGDVITKNPMILKEDLDDMKTRIRYLRAHDFDVASIARIITENPIWLTWATKHIDERLGHFQNEFYLSGPETRFLTVRSPKLITYNLKHIHENTFAVREEMGFNKKEIKALLLEKPRLWMNARKKIVDTFDYVHNTMKLSHRTIVLQSDVLACRKSRIKNRHEFLMELKKVQYDPTQLGYIAPKLMVVGSDSDFCTNIAKTTLDTYQLFLKTR